MSINVEDYLHPLMKRGLTKTPNSVYNTLMKSINKPLTQAESDIIRSKTNTMLKDSAQDWLDYFGEYLGLTRKPLESDDDYRNRLMRWITTSKNTPNSIRNAIADLLGRSADNIYIYEPYKDMIYYNQNSSKYNTLKYMASTYYNYCVIDVQIDGNFPIREVQEVVNLFRPAGVIYVLTQDINSFNPNAIISDFSSELGDFENNADFYVGFNGHDQALITPNINDDVVVDDPFHFNISDSLFNEGKEYTNKDSMFNDYMTLGEVYSNFSPDDNTTFDNGRLYNKNYPLIDNNLISVNDNKALTFNNTGYDVSKSNVDYIYALNNNAKKTGDKFTMSSGDSINIDIKDTNSNLLQGVQNLDGNELKLGGDKTPNTFMGCATFDCVNIWRGLEFNVQSMLDNIININTADTYMFSFYIKDNSSKDLSTVSYIFNGDGTIDSVDNSQDLKTILVNQLKNLKKDTWTRIVIPFKFSSLKPPSSGKFYFGFEFNTQLGSDDHVYFACPMINIGHSVSDFTTDNYVNYLTTFKLLLGNTSVKINKGNYSFNNKGTIVASSPSIGSDINLCITPLNDLAAIKNLEVHTFNSGVQTTTTHGYNTTTNRAIGIGGVTNVMRALQTLYGVSTSVKPGDIVNSKYRDCYLTLKVKGNDSLNAEHNLDMYLYDFSANVWSLFKTTRVNNNYQVINLPIKDFTNIVNSQGCMFYRFVCDTNLTVDYFALSFSNYEFNTPPLSSYFASPNLVTTTNFNNGIIGEWDRSEPTSKNLWKFNSSDIQDGWVDKTNGGIYPSSGDICLLSIPVKPNTPYTLATPLCESTLENAVWCWYDKNNKLIPNPPLTGGGSSKWTNTSFPYATFTSPDNAAYAGVSLNTDSNAKDVTVTFCEGDTYLPYPMQTQVVPNQDSATNKQFKYVLDGNGGLGKFVMGNDVKHVAYGDTYQIDAWVNTTSGFKLGLVDPDYKYFYAGPTVDSNDGGWQHVTGKTSISTYSTTTRVQPLIEILNDDCKFQLGSFTITKVN